MKIYGADFSGAKDPSEGIWYAEATLHEKQIVIERLAQCDDRLDLFAQIVSSAAPWGLDFPFSISCGALGWFNLRSWTEFLRFARDSVSPPFLGPARQDDPQGH